MKTYKKIALIVGIVIVAFLAFSVWYAGQHPEADEANYRMYTHQVSGASFLVPKECVMGLEGGGGFECKSPDFKDEGTVQEGYHIFFLAKQETSTSVMSFGTTGVTTTEVPWSSSMEEKCKAFNECTSKTIAGSEAFTIVRYKGEGVSRRDLFQTVIHKGDIVYTLNVESADYQEARFILRQMESKFSWLST